MTTLVHGNSEEKQNGNSPSSLWELFFDSRFFLNLFILKSLIILHFVGFVIVVFSFILYFLTSLLFVILFYFALTYIVYQFTLARLVGWMVGCVSTCLCRQYVWVWENVCIFQKRQLFLAGDKERTIYTYLTTTVTVCAVRSSEYGNCNVLVFFVLNSTRLRANERTTTRRSDTGEAKNSLSTKRRKKKRSLWPLNVKLLGIFVHKCAFKRKQMSRSRQICFFIRCRQNQHSFLSRQQLSCERVTDIDIHICMYYHYYAQMSEDALARSA